MPVYDNDTIHAPMRDVSSEGAITICFDILYVGWCSPWVLRRSFNDHLYATVGCIILPLYAFSCLGYCVKCSCYHAVANSQCCFSKREQRSQCVSFCRRWHRCRCLCRTFLFAQLVIAAAQPLVHSVVVALLYLSWHITKL